MATLQVYRNDGRFQIRKSPLEKPNCIIELENDPISTRVEQWKTQWPHHILLELSENLEEVCAFGQREKEKRKEKKGKALKYSPCGMKNCSCKALERNALVYEYFLIKKRRRVLMSLCLKL